MSPISLASYITLARKRLSPYQPGLLFACAADSVRAALFQR